MADSGTCIICGARVVDTQRSNANRKKVLHCDHCGNYILEDFVMPTLTGAFDAGKYQLAKLKSGLFYYLRAVKKNHLHITSESAITIVREEQAKPGQISLPSVYALYPNNFSKRLDMAMELIGSVICEIGDSFTANKSKPRPGKSGTLSISEEWTHKKEMNAFILPNKNEEEAQENETKGFFRILKDLNYITDYTKENDGSFTFTPYGWKKIDCLQRDNQIKKTVFIAMSFRAEEPMVTAEKCIKQAIQDAGYIPIIIKDKEHNNFIVDEIFYEIKKAAFVVVDLTTQNQGAYFEAGYAKALEKEVIFTCFEEDFSNTHFDTKQISTIMWKDEETFVNDLVRRIEVTVGLNRI